VSNNRVRRNRLMMRLRWRRLSPGDGNGLRRGLRVHGRWRRRRRRMMAVVHVLLLMRLMRVLLVLLVLLMRVWMRVLLRLRRSLRLALRRLRLLVWWWRRGERIGTGLRHHGRRLASWRVVDGWCRHVGDAGVRGLGAGRLGHHVGTNATEVVPRVGPRSHARLWGMSALDMVPGMRLEGNTIGNGRRCRRRVMADVWRKGLLELMGHHVRVHAILSPRRGGAVVFLLVLFIVAAVEIARTLVLVRGAMIVASADQFGHV
jgi:hypothetical protein